MEGSIEIGSAVENLYEVDDFINGLLKDYGFSRKAFCRIYLAVNEAVINCMKHGNQFFNKKKVRIEFYNAEDKYYFKIMDEGVGFDFTIIPDPSKSEFLRNESGRGIFIMKQYSDNLFFEDNGRVINLIFNK